MILALALPVMVALGGAAIDLHRQLTTRGHAQVALDAAALSASSSRQLDRTQLNVIATDYLAANLDATRFTAAPTVEIGLQDETRIQAALNGSVKTIFLGLIGITSLPVQVTSTAERGTVEEIELVLVLDNTWSMEGRDARNVKRIDALKTAARELVDGLMQHEDGTVRVGVVPYAHYVNIGTQHRGQPWLSLTEYSVPRVCTGSRSENYDCKLIERRTCERTVDGLRETYDCSTYGNCKQRTVANCSGGQSYRWYGCVQSRSLGNDRLRDTATPRYVGLVDTWDHCPRPVTLLTERRATVQAALTAMTTNMNGHRPQTYIPTGILWGINTLSPEAPFDQGQAYDGENRNPRKIMVLMTDGENTMRYRPSDGKHENTSNAGQLNQSNNDTAALCTYAKSLGIELYTVALAVENAAALNMLRRCASDQAKAFDARDSEGLTGAFRDIGASIYRVRLVR